MTLSKRIELPLVKPLYSTYHDGIGSAALVNNPSIRNWYMNEVMIFTCTPNFLKGYSSPQIRVAATCWKENPYLEKIYYDMKHLNGYVNYVIRDLINDGYYVCFSGVDDYYIKGKSWYHELHFSHDGCICGYDQENKTYCIYAYDQNWIYQKFWTPQKAFDAGRKARFEVGDFGYICGIKPTMDQVSFSCDTALKKIKQYLTSDATKDPITGEETIYGFLVQDYIVKFIDRLYSGIIPYQRTDRRVFRMIWEHKKVMHQRIEMIEDALSLDHSISNEYLPIVREADNCRMLYAAHHMKQRNEVLPIIRTKLVNFKDKEKELLEKLLEHSKEGEAK